jgi:hypothetical protein
MTKKIDVSRLIVDEHDGEVLTTRQDTDCRTALVRGLADYLNSIVFSGKYFQAQRLQFESVSEDWADPEVCEKFPVAAVYTQEPGVYAADERMTPEQRDIGNGHVLHILPELTQVLVVDVHATSKLQRTALTATLENAFDPVGWMGGFKLALPHYFGLFAHYDLLTVDFLDNEDSTSKRWRVAQFQIEARVPRAVYVGHVPRFKPRVRVEVLE